MKQKSDIKIRILVSLLILVGMIFLFLPLIKESFIGIQLSKTEVKMTHRLPDTIEEETIHIPTLTDVFEGSKASVNSYGMIQISDLNFQQPLLVGLTNQNLLQGGVAMYPHRSLLKDNFIVCGHHLGIKSLLFGGLLKVKKGMQIDVTYLKETVSYNVENIRVVEETELSVLENTMDPILTLFTCESPKRTSKRLIITAKPKRGLSNQTVIKSSDNYLSKTMSIEKKQRILQGKKVGFILLLVILGIVVCLWIVNWWL